MQQHTPSHDGCCSTQYVPPLPTALQRSAHSIMPARRTRSVAGNSPSMRCTSSSTSTTALHTVGRRAGLGAGAGHAQHRGAGHAQHRSSCSMAGSGCGLGLRKVAQRTVLVSHIFWSAAVQLVAQPCIHALRDARRRHAPSTLRCGRMRRCFQRISDNLSHFFIFVHARVRECTHVRVRARMRGNASILAATR